MKKKAFAPFHSIFRLTAEEKKYLLLVVAVFLLGLIARYFYLKNETTSLYTPDSSLLEQPHE